MAASCAARECVLRTDSGLSERFQHEHKRAETSSSLISSLLTDTLDSNANCVTLHRHSLPVMQLPC